ncbi:hypothetical protein AURDEDRAFT_178529 [Auricularia subglabra TFB-10046 SS5]|uniref:Uncharacterized protein n=1 Tax=Auricularia subglabra (strain TFB-10046 / SS5) TaxID=717982 RepID=J0WJD3_AURST|nr:hypothetical protein AURDEDRAFT_178529 [Auricularia subglabra TFB-10046 SS5]
MAMGMVPTLPTRNHSGNGKTSESWIWRGNKDVSFVDEKKRKRLDDLADDDLRVLYFRSYSQYLRWGEDGEILLEDFKRAVKSFTNYQEIWKQLADQAHQQSESVDRDAVRAIALMEAYVQDLRQGQSERRPPESSDSLRRRAQVARGQSAYASKKVAFFASMRKKAEDGLAEATVMIGEMVDEFGKHALELNDARDQALREEEPGDARQNRRRRVRY